MEVTSHIKHLNYNLLIIKHGTALDVILILLINNTISVILIQRSI